MNTALWVVQALLAFLFLPAGLRKLAPPRERLAKTTPQLGKLPLPVVRSIGCVEVLGTIGLILPAASGIEPMLTPAAAAGFALLMLGATGFHAVRGEYAKIGLTGGLLMLALFVVYGRLVLAPIAA